MSHNKTDFLKIFQLEALQMQTARNKAQIIHKGKNIKFSGSEVEGSVRGFFERRLPKRYAVGHGHIVDANMHISPHYDIIIYDAFHTPSLFSSANELNYLPYEAVYAIGEVKSTWRSANKPILEFISNLAKLKNLSRADVHPLDYGIDGWPANNFTIDVINPIRNPLFKFMLFVDKGDFNEKLTGDRIAMENVPSVICLLNHSNLMSFPVSNIDGVLKPDSTPNHCYEWGPKEQESRYVISNFDKDGEFREGGNLAALLFLLLGFLSRCKLGRLSYNDYLGAYLRPGPA